MRTTITIDDHLIIELMYESNAASRSQAIREAIESYLARKRRERFKKLAGTRISDLDWKQLEEAEIHELRDG